MNDLSPIALRTKAADHGRKADVAMKAKDYSAARRHIEKARKLTLLALKLEQEGGRTA